MMRKKKQLVFLKEQKTGCLSMFSSNSKFLTKTKLFKGRGGTSSETKRILQGKSSKILAKNGARKKKQLVFLKEQKTGYHSMLLSQFRNFWRKPTFLRGGLKHNRVNKHIIFLQAFAQKLLSRQVLFFFASYKIFLF